MSLNEESEIEYSFPPVLVNRIAVGGSGLCGTRSVNVQCDINLATSVTAVRV